MRGGEAMSRREADMAEFERLTADLDSELQYRWVPDSGVGGTEA